MVYITVVQDDTKFDIDLKISRICKPSRANARLTERVWKNHHLSTTAKIKLYKAVVLNTPHYGSETWVLYAGHIEQLDKFHQCCLRKILNVKYQDKNSNNTILVRVNIGKMDVILKEQHL